MKQMITTVFLTSVCAMTAMGFCPDAVINCPQPKKTACCYDSYREPYRIAYPRMMRVPEQVEITATDRALQMRRLAVLRMRNMVQFEKEILAATTPLSQPAQSGVVVFGSTEGAGVYDTGNCTVPPPPPYPGPGATVCPPPVSARVGQSAPIVAAPVPGKPGFVYSPFTSNPCLVNVQSLTPGSVARDPYTGEAFRVP